MNWLHFFLWIAGLYALYYLIIVLLDLAGGSGKPGAGSAPPVLTFSEHVEPIQLKQSSAENSGHKSRLNEDNPSPQPKKEVIASGGVSLKDLFTLARQEAIIYTNSVSY